MKRKVVSVMLCTAMSLSLLAGCGGNAKESSDGGSAKEATESTEKKSGDKVKLGVLVYKYDDTYISTVRSAIEKYAKDADVEIKLDMQDGQGDQSKQNDQLDVLLSKGVDAILINAVDTGSAQGLADKAKAAGIPAVFFNREPSKEVVESCEGIFVGTTASEAGVMQGNMLADMYDADQAAIDKNGDGKIQYLVFKGEPGNPEAEARTEYAVKQAEERGLVMDNMKVEPLVANWMTDQAQTQMEAQMAANGDKIEAIFCNNDDMALGAIAGINGKSDAPVFGVDATEAGMEAVKAGKMAGTVKQDGDAMGKALVAIGANAAQGKDFIEGTDYEMADDGFSVRIPYAPITK